jgi:diphosphomevalonate decarboxylase
MNKATATAPTNIAFIKYWGRKDETLRLPENGSISLCISELITTTTVEFRDELTEDDVVINGTRHEGESSRVTLHLDRIRSQAGITTFARVASTNSFPTATGLSSSASGFAALTVAAAAAAGLQLSEKELSILARQGSGSACRSIPGGWVEWLDGNTSEDSYAVSLYPADYWDIVDVVAVVSTGRKDVSTSEGQKLISTSPFFEARKAGMKQKITDIKQAIGARDFTQFGQITEAEALNMHAVMLTSNPALIYWTSGTLEIMKLCSLWRQAGLEVYFTINTGQDIHLLVQKKDQDALIQKLKELECVRDIFVNTPTHGTQIIDSHLF